MKKLSISLASILFLTLFMSMPALAQEEEEIDQAPAAAFRYFWETVNNGQYAQSWAMLSSGSQQNFVSNIYNSYRNQKIRSRSSFSSEESCRSLMSEGTHEMVRNIWQGVNSSFNGSAFLNSRIMTVKNDGQRALVVSDCSQRGYLMIKENGRWLIDFMH